MPVEEEQDRLPYFQRGGGGEGKPDQGGLSNFLDFFHLSRRTKASIESQKEVALTKGHGGIEVLLRGGRIRKGESMGGGGS